MRLNPHVFWLFGLSGAGKSTLARRLSNSLRDFAVPVLELDGDDLRCGLCRGLGFSEQDRTENLRRAAEVARLGLKSGLCVVASFITPLEAQRRLVRSVVGPALSLVYIDAPLATCQQRDTKGLYARAALGDLTGMTGVSSRFDVPVDADLTILSGAHSIEACSIQLAAFSDYELYHSHS